MSFIASLLDSYIFGGGDHYHRHGKYQCYCGTIQINLNVPPSSYMIVEQTTAICHCNDCTNFVKACGTNGYKLLENNATQLVQFYKSDVKVIKGQKDIGYVRLHSSSKSPMIRCYCKKCGTPLGADIDSTPLLLLYANLIINDKDGNMPIYLPHLVLNYGSSKTKSSSDGSTVRPYDRETIVRQGIFAPYFILRAIARLILGLIMNKGSTSTNEESDDGGCGLLVGGLASSTKDKIPIGIDKIKISSSSSSSSESGQ